MHAAFNPLYSPFNIPTAFVPMILAAVVWTLILKGYALWFSARSGQKWWFVVLLVLNTLGILEIVYLMWFRPKSEALATAPTHSSPE